MSGLEIERKFLVKKGDAYKSAAFSSSHIQQGYIPAEGATVRVRTRDGKAELAMLYFPTATPRVALNRLVRWINRCPELKQSLCSGYAGKFSHFYTRQQVAEIIEFLDEP